MGTPVRSFLAMRVLPFALLLVAAIVFTGAAVVLVFAKGVAFTASVSGLLLQVPIALGLALVTRGVLVRVKKLPPDALGLTLDVRAAMELGASTVVGLGVPTLAVIALWATGIAPFARSSVPLSAGVLAVGLLAAVVNAAIQQLPLQGFALALGPAGKPSLAAAGFASLLFMATHVEPHSTPLFLMNVFLFGAVTSLLFFRAPKPSFAAPVGFHGGWNFALIFLLGAPGGGLHTPLGILRWPASERLLLGGEEGFDGGLANTVLLVALACALVTARRRRV